MATSFFQSLYNLPAFRREFLALQLASIRSGFPNLLSPDASNFDVSYLLTLASALALSDDAQHASASYRIAHYAMSGSSETNNMPNAAAFILDRLGSFPSLTLGTQRGLIKRDFRNFWPPPIKLSAFRNRLRRMVAIGSNSAEYLLTDFQKQVFDSINSKRVIAISSPTSTGKSFITQLIMLNQMSQNETCKILYIVPTRALISQVELDLRDFLAASETSLNPEITTVPFDFGEEESRHRIHIFTQERAHWFLCDHPKARFDLVFVDEAQSVGNGHRGVLLESVIEQVSTSDQTRMVFLTPGFRNPEIFLRMVSKTTNETESLSTSVMGTNQNLLFLQQVRRKPREFTVQADLKDFGTLELGRLQTPSAPSPLERRLPVLAFALEGTQASAIIYADGAAMAEKQASLLADLMQTDIAHPELDATISLVQSVIHKDYLLASVLRRGVAFHYGNMPDVIRSQIERLFRLEIIKYLVTTSTLIEGVNLPARSVYLRNPKRGPNPFSRDDFLNMSGRAGRLGREFQGNVIVVDPTVWKEKPFQVDQQPEVQPATATLSADFPAYLEYTQKMPTVAVPRFEAGLSYHFTNLQTKDYLPNKDQVRQLNGALAQFNVTLPRDLLVRNLGISPPRIQRLYEHFTKRKDELEDLIPEEPGSDYATRSYRMVLEHAVLFLGAGYHPKRINQLAVLVAQWIGGWPISRIIANNWKFRAPQGKQLSAVIRQTLGDIETFCRYEFLKYHRCYSDALRAACIATDQTNLAELIPKLDAWLEFGVATKTQLSLLRLGLTRTTATSIFAEMASDDLDPSAAKAWLLLNHKRLQISPILLREIRTKIGIAKKDD